MIGHSDDHAIVVDATNAPVTVNVSSSTIVLNNFGITRLGGAVVNSFGNNSVSDDTSFGTFTATVAQQ